MAHWRFIPRCVRPYFVRRVCVVGPESTGKTTLAAALARHFETTWVPEYARTLLEPRASVTDPNVAPRAPVAREDMPRIARGQIASEEALARSANRVLFADTDALTTLMWSDLLFGDHEPILDEHAAAHEHDLYLLCAPDVTFVADAVRYAPAARDAFFARMRSELERRGRHYVVLSGGWDERLERAIEAVQTGLFC